MNENIDSIDAMQSKRERLQPQNASVNPSQASSTAQMAAVVVATRPKTKIVFIIYILQNFNFLTTPMNLDQDYHIV